MNIICFHVPIHKAIIKNAIHPLKYIPHTLKWKLSPIFYIFFEFLSLIIFTKGIRLLIKQTVLLSLAGRRLWGFGSWRKYCICYTSWAAFQTYPRLRPCDCDAQCSATKLFSHHDDCSYWRLKAFKVDAIFLYQMLNYRHTSLYV